MMTDFSHTLPCEWRDYPEWHRGRRRYAVWTLPVECPRILARLAAAREHLGDWLHEGNRRQAHVTLFVCGFPGDDCRFDDDFPTWQFEAQLEALHRLDVAPFELGIGRLQSFASAAFLEVSSHCSSLERLREALAGSGAEIRRAAYRAHLTVGLYARSVPYALLQERLRSFAEQTPLPLAVQELHYSTYAAAELLGPLRCERRLPLR